MKETNYAQSKGKENYQEGSYEWLQDYRLMPKEKGELENMLNQNKIGRISKSYSKSMKGGKENDKGI